VIFPEQEHPADALSAQGVPVKIEDDRQQPGLQFRTGGMELAIPDDPQPGFLEEVLRLSPISCQMKNKPEDIGFVPVVDRFKIAAAAHLNK